MSQAKNVRARLKRPDPLDAYALQRVRLPDETFRLWPLSRCSHRARVLFRFHRVDRAGCRGRWRRRRDGCARSEGRAAQRLLACVRSRSGLREARLVRVRRTLCPSGRDHVSRRRPLLDHWLRRRVRGRHLPVHLPLMETAVTVSQIRSAPRREVTCPEWWGDDATRGDGKSAGWGRPRPARSTPGHRRCERP